MIERGSPFEGLVQDVEAEKGEGLSCRLVGSSVVVV